MTTQATILPAGGLATADAPPLQLPAEHFAAALGFLALGAVGLVWVAPELSEGAFLVPRVAGVVHLFTLGFITTSILGALYQFLPVAVGTPIRSRRVAHVSFAMLVVGLPTFVLGLTGNAPRLVPLGACTVALALAFFACNMIATLARASTRTLTWWALVGASGFLVVTLGFGLALATNLTTWFLGESRFAVLATHVHLAIVGWVMLVMVGVAHRLMPMFLVSHGATERPGWVAVVCLVSGCALLALPLGSGGEVAGAIFIAAGVVAFLVQAVCFYRHRRKPRLDPGLRLASAGLLGVCVALVMAPFALARGLESPRLLTAYVFILVVGGISLFTAGHLYKIVPFLVWYHRFGSLVGTQPVPTVADLYSKRMAQASVAALVAGVIVSAVGILCASTPLVRAGALAFAAGVALEIREMTRIAGRRLA
jgi:hypothetical protein